MKRLHSSPDLNTAYDAWLLDAGPTSFAKPNWRDLRAGRSWRKLIDVAADIPFTSCNDAAVEKHYAEADKAAREQDRKRKTRERSKELRQGHLDEQHLDDLKSALMWRAQRIVDAVRHARETGQPRSLSRLPTQSIRELLDVWLIGERLRATKQRPTAAAIAREIDAQGSSNQSRSLDALSTRVSRDLRRIARLEKMPWDNSVVLPPFDPSMEFSP